MEPRSRRTDKVINLGVNCQGYADDIAIIVRGKFEETLCLLTHYGVLNFTPLENSVLIPVNIPHKREFSIEIL